MSEFKFYCFVIMIVIVFCANSNAAEGDSSNRDNYAKIGVSIAESINGIENNNISVCENVIEKELIDVKYHVVHNKFIANFDDTKAFAELVGSEESKAGSEESQPEMEIRPSIRKVIKNTRADILIVGEANVVLLSDEPIQKTEWANIYSARAEGLFKVIEVKTGKVIFTLNEMQSGADVSATTAYKKALSNLGLHAGRGIVEKLLMQEE